MKSLKTNRSKRPIPDYSHDTGNFLPDVHAAAIFFLKKAVDYNSENISALENIGVAYSISGKFSIALKYFLQVLSINPNNPKTHLNLALTYENLGQSKLANEHLSMHNKLKNKK